MRSQLAEFETIPSERLADLLMLSHEPMFAWKLDGAIKFWNAGAERLYGFPSNEAVGHSSHSLLQTKFPIKVAELHSQQRRRRQNRRRIEDREGCYRTKANSRTRRYARP